MKPRKRWVKKVLLIALIAGVIGASAAAAAEMVSPEHREAAFNHVKQSAQQFIPKSNEKPISGHVSSEHDKGLREAGHEHHDDGMKAGMAVGGTVLAAGLLYWIVRGRKRNSKLLKSNSTHAILPTSDFLDQWENNLINSKETN
ncbi:hypothetical protein [Paenibacillus whitsoniae]|uniref:Uncharacterized protein n=1 Tax=Paenibacillus whitsoniae TaxID=2496558 RepID=A0A430JIW7_9BACL|nr:hypothetical protein [Paenibacillus whitsoniae]RTE10960.1 hypothetical protein EJQ19_04275 [Paenibacillus whitsoniae]